MSVKQRRRRSDAKWRASIAGCYETLKQIVLIDNNGKEGRRMKITKAMILKEASKHMVFLEGLLQTLLKEKAKLVGNSEDLSMEKVKQQFIEHQAKLQTKSSKAKERAVKVNRNPIKSQLQYPWDSFDYQVVPSDAQGQVFDKLETVHPGSLACLERCHSPVLGPKQLLPRPTLVKPQLKQAAISKQPPITETLTRQMLNATKNQPQAFGMPPIEKIQSKKKTKGKINKKLPQKQEPSEKQENKSEQIVPAAPGTKPNGWLSKSRPLDMAQLVPGDGMEDLTSVLSLRIENVVSETAPYLEGTWSLGTPSKKDHVVIFHQKYSPGFTPIKLPDNWKDDAQTDARNSEDLDDESLLCHETMEAINLEDEIDGFSDEASEWNSPRDSKNQHQLNNGLYFSQSQSEDSPTPTKRKPGEAAVSENPKCRRKLEGMYQRRSKSRFKVVAKDSAELKSDDSQITQTKLVKFGRKKSDKPSTCSPAPNSKPATVALQALEPASTPTPNCQDFDGYLKFYKETAKELDVKPECLSSTIADMWQKLPEDFRETMVTMAMVENSSDDSQSSDLSDDLKEVTSSLFTEEEKMMTYPVEVIDDFLEKQEKALEAKDPQELEEKSTGPDSSDEPPGDINVSQDNDSSTLNFGQELDFDIDFNATDESLYEMVGNKSPLHLMSDGLIPESNEFAMVPGEKVIRSPSHKELHEVPEDFGILDFSDDSVYF
ncbi:uncharacterized protein LOC106167240 isoform X2 [Lingula anatina]|uniref:Uncharacterized protein LOC106167240 isoform X2 n=1 Tax=Lingula anatina TaxID=7574 RepID=A0A1S3IU04_LINAN|nr:uncharacterized protein LOC106167240 isoform X2 [Lingula anatina]|eukprot:XP_013401416.1 uncharacterized protein LOC106167240 isoform X2 [Lingula anatina]